MTHFIAHRINTLPTLKDVPSEYGVELDLRDRGDRLILQHDPFGDGEDAEPYFAKYNPHGTLILNIKSERIEHRVLELMKKYRIENYFFLDSSFPMIYLLSKQGEKRLALRFSEFEALDTIYNLKGKVDWVWVDCFTKLPINKTTHTELKAAGFKLCLVSPELQGRPDDIAPYREQLNKEGIQFDAICTKLHNIDFWKAK